MAGKIALVDFGKCRPQDCAGGICAAAAACPRKLIKQEAPHDVPMTDPFACRGCADCVRACPARAILITTQ